MDRRSLLTFAAALTLPFVSPVSSAKDAVRLVVPFPAAGQKRRQRPGLRHKRHPLREFPSVPEPQV